SAIIARGGSSLGIGFAIPVNLAQPIVAQLAEYGETRRGWLGVGIQEVTDDIASSLGRPNDNGALVVDVTKTGPAAGVLDQGDVILQFNPKDILKLKDLPRYVAEAAVGEDVVVRVLRGGAEQELHVKLGRLEGNDPTVAAATPPASTPGPQPDVDEPVGPAPSLQRMVGFELRAVDDTYVE